MILEKLESNNPFVTCPNDGLKVLQQRRRRRPTDEEYLAICLMKLSRAGGNHGTTALAIHGLSKSQPPSSNSSQPLLRHKCVVCSKSFSSYQALGGHKTSHRRRNAATAPSFDQASISTNNNNNKSYECDICRKKFLTGQALGGHKRCHYEGRSNIVNGAVLLLDDPLTTNGGSSKSDNKGLGFDLNSPASPEFRNFDVDEDEIEAGPVGTKKARLFLSLKLDLLRV